MTDRDQPDAGIMELFNSDTEFGNEIGTDLGTSRLRAVRRGRRHWSIVIWGLGRLALRSGTSPAPNAIRTARAEGLQRPDDK